MPTVLDISPDTEETRKTVEDCLSQLSTLRSGMPILCIYQDQDHERMNHRYVRRIRELVRNIPPHKKVVVLLSSAGGDIECAYRIVSAIRRYAEDWLEVIVIDWAKSAATFFTLAADKILLGADGELGPLDPQLKSPRGSLERASALESFKGLEYLRTYSLETLHTIIQILTDELEIDVPYALEHAQEIISAIVTPLYEQVNPHDLGSWRRTLSISEDYAKRVMQRWGYRNRGESLINRIIERLVWGYPTHGFVIDFDEAKALGLNVELLDEKATALGTRILETVAGVTGIWIPATQNGVGAGVLSETKVQEEAHDGKPTETVGDSERTTVKA